MFPSQPTAPLRDRFNRFFHSEEVPYGLALVRIGLPLVLLTTMIARWPHARELYSTDGVTTPLSLGYGYPEVFPVFPGAVAVGLMTLLIAAMISLAAGWCTRISLAICFVLYTYFTQIDGLSTMAKYSCVATHGMLLMMFTNCGSVLSVDAWLRKRRSEGGTQPPGRSPVWPQRLLQCLVGVVYFATAMTKIQSPDFFTGERLTSWMLGNYASDHTLGQFAAMFPAIGIVSAYASVVWEILFLFLVWKSSGRFWMLSCGVMFHLATFFLLGLTTFPFVFLVLYFAFFSQEEYERLGGRLLAWKQRAFGARIGEGRTQQKQLPQWQFPSGAVFGCTLLASVLAGIEAEHLLDPYGMSGADGPLELTVIEPDRVREMLSDDRLIREKDKFFGFDVGTSLFGGALSNRRTEFEHGEIVIAQCVLNPPHDDMWIECNLHDARDQLILRNNDLANRESMRVNFKFPLDAQLAPGEYSLVLKSRGSEIARRKFRLTGTASSAEALNPVAN